MELQTWHLLILPLFFVFGWLAARVDIRHVIEESRSVPRSYFKGLNHLLNEQPDKAIEAFMEVARLDPDTLELHFALGALFRRRGELDRSLRIHQSLLERADLNQEDRQKAQYELGLDFFKAGLLDRAEAVFVKLESGSHALDVLRHLLDIRILTRDWVQAIETARRIQKLGGSVLHTDIAHFHCELAAVALLRGDEAGARRELEAALLENPRSARAMSQLGEIEMQRGRSERALKHWVRIADLNPRYLPLVAERMMQAHAALGRAGEGIELLRACLERIHSPDLLHSVFQAVAQHQGWPAARQLAGEVLRAQPSLRALDDYLQASNATGQAPAGDSLESQVAQDVVHAQVSQSAQYVCGSCGFRARQFFWQCPACARWDSIPPERSAHV